MVSQAKTFEKSTNRKRPVTLLCSVFPKHRGQNVMCMDGTLADLSKLLSALLGTVLPIHNNKAVVYTDGTLAGF